MKKAQPTKLIVMAWLMSSLLLISGCDNSTVEDNSIIFVNDEGVSTVSEENLQIALESIPTGELDLTPT